MQEDGKMEGVESERNFTVPMKTTSLDHMLPEDDNEVAKSGDLNIVCSKFKPNVHECNSNNGIEQVQVLTTHAVDSNSIFTCFRNIGYNEMEKRSIDQ